jgi:putative DNA primase/helicase
MSSTAAADLASRLGLRKHPRSWRGDCPCCSYARALSVRDGKGGRLRVYCANGCGHDALDDALSRIVGGSWKPPKRDVAGRGAGVREHQRAGALRLWDGCEPSAAGTVGDRYLLGRRLSGLATSPALRFRGDCPHPEGGRLPALVALVQNAVGAPIGVHRTYLRHDGSGKAAVEPPRASLGPIWGGAVRLDPLAIELVIGEGIESSASAGRLLGLPAWAALSAANLARGLVLPPDVRSVVIAADNDLPDQRGRRNGQDAARAAWHRWTAEGRRVRIALPRKEGHDFNDAICEAPNG